jgi:hypothetical protein
VTLIYVGLLCFADCKTYYCSTLVVALIVDVCDSGFRLGWDWSWRRWVWGWICFEAAAMVMAL